MKQADLQDVNFKQSSFSGAIITDSNMTWTNLSGCSVEDSDFTDTRFYASMMKEGTFNTHSQNSPTSIGGGMNASL